MHRVNDPEDPRRCQGAAPDGQCWNEAEYGSDYCVAHGGKSTENAEAVRLYRLNEVRYRDRLAQFTETDLVSNLIEAISLARMLVEKRINLEAQNPGLFRDHGIINTLQLTIKRLTKSATKIENDLDALTRKSKFFRWGQSALQIVADELCELDNSREIIARISTKFINTISTANNDSEMETTDMNSLLVGGQVKAPTAFKLTKAEDQMRLAELANNNMIRSLIEDIALQMTLIERTWNSVKSDVELISVSPMLNQSLRVLEELISSAINLEQLRGALCSPETEQRLGSVLGKIIRGELEHLPESAFELTIDRILERHQALQITSQ